MEIFIVYHWNKLGVQDIKTIGVYSTLELAEAGIERVGQKPGFKERPEGFYVVRHTVDEDNWTEGFTEKIQ